MESGKKIIGVLVVVAIGQIIGWGTVGLLAVVGREVAADLGMDISAVFAGNSIFYVATGLTAPVLAKAFIRWMRNHGWDDLTEHERYVMQELFAAVNQATA